MEQRLQKLLSSYGILSRRSAERYIQDGRVTVDGVVATLGMKADPDTQQIEVDGVPVTAEERRVYLMLNKPRGYVTTLSDEKGRKNAGELVRDCGVRVWPIGRLDMNSEGLLLFTNDGDLTNKLLHPSRLVEKEYLVRVKGDIISGLTRLSQPMSLCGTKLRIPQVSVVKEQEPRGDTTLLSFTITEGKNRQIRRMCDCAGLRVLRLKRIREGKVRLGDLKPGTWRFLKKDEIKALFSE